MYVLPPEATEAEFRELLAYWESKLAPRHFARTAAYRPDRT